MPNNATIWGIGNPPPAAGSVAFDNNTVGTYSGNTTQSFSFTTGGSNRYILVGTVCDRAPAAPPQYNGVSLGLLGTVSLSALVTLELRLYGLKAPATGANNVTVDWSGGPPTDAITFVGSFKDVHQTTSTGTVVTNLIDAQTQAFSTAQVTGLTAGQGVFSVMVTYNKTMTCPSLTLLNTSNPTGAQAGASGYKITTGTEACQFNWSGNQIWGEISVPLLPA